MGTLSSKLEREEYVEQRYFFHALRERLVEGQPMQEVLARVGQEILATTRLPYAIDFLAAELKHSGLAASGFTRLGHYFTPFQAFVVAAAEEENRRFSITEALLILEREAEYRATQPTPAGLFVYQFETLCRNRLGYDAGLTAMIGDPFYDDDWKVFIDMTRRQVGLVELADLLFLRSHLYVSEQRRRQPDYEPSLPPLFGEKEGKIGRANVGRDPLYLFAALQRQLGYPEVPRPRPRDDVKTRLDAVQAKLKEFDTRLRLLESEMKGQVDLSQFARPELLEDDEEPGTQAK
jgi:hypothetical protein